MRTNAYGWSPESAGRCWISETLADLKSHSAGPFDHLRYATPILTTDLTEILEQAWQNNLHGIYHVTGAERVNPNQFVEHLANEFGLPVPQPVNGNALSGRPTGFGRGETSLHTSKIRKDLNIAMPMLAAMADVVGIFGGMVVAVADQGLTYISIQAFTRTDSGLGFSLFTRRY